MSYPVATEEQVPMPGTDQANGLKFEWNTSNESVENFFKLFHEPSAVSNPIPREFITPIKRDNIPAAELEKSSTENPSKFTYPYHNTEPVREQVTNTVTSDLHQPTPAPQIHAESLTLPVANPPSRTQFQYGTPAISNDNNPALNNPQQYAYRQSPIAPPYQSYQQPHNYAPPALHNQSNNTVISQNSTPKTLPQMNVQQPTNFPPQQAQMQPQIKAPTQRKVAYVEDNNVEVRVADNNLNALLQPHMENKNLSIVATTISNGSSDVQYCDITEYLNFPQIEAARKLHLPPSTLSKRWKEAAPNRKWPWRTVCKLDKEISTLLHNIPPDGTISKQIEGKLAVLIQQRQEELKPIVIRL